MTLFQREAPHFGSNSFRQQRSDPWDMMFPYTQDNLARSIELQADLEHCLRRNLHDLQLDQVVALREPDTPKLCP